MTSHTRPRTSCAGWRPTPPRRRSSWS